MMPRKLSTAVTRYRQAIPRDLIFSSNPHSSYPPPPLDDGDGLRHFSEHLYRRDLGQIGIFGWNWHFWWGVIFFRWDLKTPCIKNSDYKSQAKKNNSICNFYNFSLLFPYPNKSVVVCICISVFHGIYPPPLPTHIFLCGGHIFVCVCVCIVAMCWKYFKLVGAFNIGES